MSGDAQGRAIVRISDPPFRYPAVEIDGDLVAFLESEAAEGYCDQTADVDQSDAILRVFALGGGERTATLTPPRVVDAALAVNGRALAISNGLVFYRRPERGPAPRLTSRTSVGPLGVEASQGILPYDTGPSLNLSADGNVTIFVSASDDLVPGDTNGVDDAFVHDHATGTTERVSVSSGGGAANSSAIAVAVSGDGRFAAFGAYASNLVPGDTNVQADVFVHDRLADTTERVSVATGGVEASGGNPGFTASRRRRHHARRSIRALRLRSSRISSRAIPTTTSTCSCTTASCSTTDRASVKTGGGEIAGGNSGMFFGAISADGRFVVFRGELDDIVPGDTNGRVRRLRPRPPHQYDRARERHDGRRPGRVGLLRTTRLPRHLRRWAHRALRERRGLGIRRHQRRERHLCP